MLEADRIDVSGLNLWKAEILGCRAVLVRRQIGRSADMVKKHKKMHQRFI
jgi:hypothetical protein